MQQISFGTNLRKLLRQNKMSMKELGRRLGVEAATVSRYACGEREPSRETLVAISELFGVSLDWLITGKDPEKSASAADVHRLTITVQGSWSLDEDIPGTEDKR